MEKVTIKNLKAFTLAEVLIVLAILGVVSALTIPALVQQHQKATYVAQLQKAYSTLNNGFKQIMANTNCSDISCTGIISLSSDQTVDNIAASGVLGVIKSCHLGQTGCHDKQIYQLDKSLAWIPGEHYSLLILKDGLVFGFNAPASSCDYVAGTNQYSNTCTVYTFLDVNGPNPPNTFGRDVFRFQLSKNGVVLPAGGQDDTMWGHWKDTSSDFNCINSIGQACFGRIIEEGWKMNY